MVRIPVLVCAPLEWPASFFIKKNRCLTLTFKAESPFRMRTGRLDQLDEFLLINCRLPNSTGPTLGALQPLRVGATTLHCEDAPPLSQLYLPLMDKRLARDWAARYGPCSRTSFLKISSAATLSSSVTRQPANGSHSSSLMFYKIH